MSDELPGEQGDPARGVHDVELDQFIEELMAAQTGLRAYITASLGSVWDVSDVLQQTNLKLWKNAKKFRPGSKFMPWAITIAKYEILSYCRNKGRDRHVFPEDVAALMLDTVLEVCPDPTDRQQALQICLEKLPQKQRAMLNHRYYEGRSISQIAEVMKRSENAIKCAIVRVRRALQACIESRMNSSSA